MSVFRNVTMEAISSSFSGLPSWYSPISLTASSQSGHFSSVEVGLCLVDVPERGHFEYQPVTFLLRHRLAPGIGSVRIRFHESQFLVNLAAQVGPCVAGLAARFHVLVEAGFLRVAKGCLDLP